MAQVALPKTTERRASWLELFYDLVFVIAVSKVASHLNADVSTRGFGIFAGLFLIVLIAWSGYASYTARYDLDDRFHRLITLAQMLAAAAMAVQLGNVPGTGDTGFVLAYMGIRACLVALYVRVWPQYPEVQSMNSLLVAAYSGALALWACSLLVAGPTRYVVWGLALGVEMAGPVYGAGRFARRNADTSLLPERYGLFTLIVLGEAIFAVITNLGQQAWQPAGLVGALMGFGLAVAIWWSYFNYVERAPLQCSLGNGQLYSYLHLPMIVGLTMASVGVGRTIREAELATLTPGTVVALLGGLALFLLCFLLIQVTTYPRDLAAMLWKSYGPALLSLAGLAVSAAVLPPLMTLGAALLVVSTLAAMDVRWRIAVPARSYSLPDADPRDTPTLKKYLAPEVEVTFDPALCIHSGECLKRLPNVFNVRDRPWVRPDRADPKAVVSAVHHCPTAALKIARGPAPVAHAFERTNQAVVTLVPDGPALIASEHGIHVEGAQAPPPGPMVALCRCGLSKNLPYCDGSHERATPVGE